LELSFLLIRYDRPTHSNAERNLVRPFMTKLKINEQQKPQRPQTALQSQKSDQNSLWWKGFVKQVSLIMPTF